MKKVLLFAILALSVNAFAQSNHPLATLYPSINTIVNNNYRLEPGTCKTPGQRSLFQIYDSVYHWQWDTISSSWLVQSKTIDLVYDAGNNLLNYTTQIRNAGAWENSENYTASYDANGNLTSRITQIWNSNWVNSRKNTYTYNADNNQTSNIGQIWDGHSWINTSQIIYSYDAANNLISYLYQDWNGTLWVNNSLSSYSYDAGNNETNELAQIWNSTTWENSRQYLYSYDANNLLVNELVQDWNGSAWLDSQRSIYAYDNSDNLTNVLSQVFENGNWDNSSQSIFTFDANNNLAGISGQNWYSNAWVNAWNFTYAYDVNNFTTSYTYKYWDNTGTELIGGDSSYYYSHTVVGINKLVAQDQSISIFPNPGNGKITLNSYNAITSIEIYNLVGETIYSDFNLSCQTTKAVDISNVSKGIYFVKVQIGKKEINKKIVIY
ncbi:MAG: T9SS type A sorting domain-containing protein [Bacteroidales bacterium]